MSFNKDNQTGEITTITYYNQKTNLHGDKYDYDLDKNGNIVTHDYFRKAKVGQINQTELTELHNIFKEKSQNITKI